MTEIEIPFEGIFGSTPELKTLQFLIAHSHFDYTKKELAENAGISRQTVYKVLKLFLKTFAVDKKLFRRNNSFFRFFFISNRDILNFKTIEQIAG